MASSLKENPYTIEAAEYLPKREKSFDIREYFDLLYLAYLLHRRRCFH
jgi:hypothetical protein